MGKIKEEIQELFDTCKRKYEEGGVIEVVGYIEEAIRQGDNPLMLEVTYERCEACDANMPSINNTCLVCGQPTRYFKVVHDGFEKASEREEIRIHAGEHGNIVIYRDNDKLGFIIDVYGENDHIDSLTIWEDDMNPADEDGK